MLLVLALIGLISAMVAPNLQKLAGIVERATLRDGVLADIAGLNYRAYSLGQGFELSEASLGQTLSDGNPILLPPAGWRVQVESPIIFAFNGMCSGGLVTITSPGATVERLRLVAPVCHVISE